MSNVFEAANAVVTSAQFRGKVGKVVLNLNNGEVIFAAPRVVNNVVGYQLNPSTVQMIAGSTVYYDKSSVKAGSKYKWNATDTEELVAESNLEIRNITSVLVPVDRLEFLMGHCEAVASQDDWDKAAAPKAEAEPAPEGATESEDDAEEDATETKVSSKKGSK